MIKGYKIINANERITTRVSIETKDLLEKALVLSGYASLNSFIANAAVAEAKKLIEQNMRIRLFQEDAEAFVNALERPIKINERFLRAARQHKETITNADKVWKNFFDFTNCKAIVVEEVPIQVESEPTAYKENMNGRDLEIY